MIRHDRLTYSAEWITPAAPPYVAEPPGWTCPLSEFWHVYSVLLKTETEWSALSVALVVGTLRVTPWVGADPNVTRQPTWVNPPPGPAVEGYRATKFVVQPGAKLLPLFNGDAQFAPPQGISVNLVIELVASDRPLPSWG